MTPATVVGAASRIGADQWGVSAIAVDGERALWVANTPACPGGSCLRVDRRLFIRAGGRTLRSVVLEKVSEPDGSETQYSSGSNVIRLEASGATALIVERSFDELASKIGEGEARATTLVSTVDLSTGRRTKVEHCARADADLAGTLLVTSGCSGQGQPAGSVQLRDLARPGEPPSRLADGASSVDAAGRMIAWLIDGSFTVMDVDSGVRRTIDTAPVGPGAIARWELDADGSVAFVIDPRPPDPASEAVAVARADGSPPMVLARRGGILALAFAAGRVTVAVRTNAQEAQLGVHEVVRMSEDGTSRVLARGGDVSALDADGTHLAYSSLRCDPGVFDVLLQPVDDDGPNDVSRAGCMPTLDDTASVGRRGVVRYYVTCPELIPVERAARPCSFRVDARIGRHRLARQRRTVREGSSSAAQLSWRLPARLRTARAMRVTVAVTRGGRTTRQARTVRLTRDDTAARAAVAPKKPPPCPRGALHESSVAKLYYGGDDENRQVVACVRSTRRRTVLASWFEQGSSTDDPAPQSWLAGRFAAVNQAACPADPASTAPCTGNLRVIDLRTRRIHATVPTGDPIFDLVLTRRGSVGLIHRHQVIAAVGADVRTLDAQPDAGSLAYAETGRRLYWTTAGQPRTAALP